MKKKLAKSERAAELSRRVAELKQELERLPAARQDVFREGLEKETRKSL